MTSASHTLDDSMVLDKTPPGLVTVVFICFTVTLLGVPLTGRANCATSVSHTLNVRRFLSRLSLDL